ncbi:MAG: hypothetical protein LUB83_00060 [Prevotellaceae bacterium]|nr:hypothetical protein [Prevotellaceae bacterium]
MKARLTRCASRRLYVIPTVTIEKRVFYSFAYYVEFHWLHFTLEMEIIRK